MNAARIIFAALALSVFCSCTASYFSYDYRGPSSTRKMDTDPIPGPFRILMIRNGMLDELRDILVARGHTVEGPHQLTSSSMEDYDAVVTLIKRRPRERIHPCLFYSSAMITLFTLAIVPGFELYRMEEEILIASPRRKTRTRIRYHFDKTLITSVWYVPALFHDDARDYMETNLELQLKLAARIEDVAESSRIADSGAGATPPVDGPAP